MADVARPKFTRVPDAPKAEQASPSNLQKVQIAPAIVPHRVSREIGSLSLLLIGICIGVVMTLAITTSLIPMASEILARGVAIGAARTGE